MVNKDLCLLITEARNPKKETEDGVQSVEDQAITLLNTTSAEETTRKEILQDIRTQPKMQAAIPMKRKTMHFV